MFVLLTIQVSNFNLHKASQNTHFYNPVVQFFNLALTVQFLHPSTTVQLLQFGFGSPIFASHFRQSRFDSPVFTIQSGTSISLNTQDVSKYFFEKVSGIYWRFSIKNRLCALPKCKNHLSQLVEKPSIFTTSNGSYSYTAFTPKLKLSYWRCHII